eukprot:scaffold6790_cov99-Isochrysis_galbana.AAC.4
MRSYSTGRCSRTVEMPWKAWMRASWARSITCDTEHYGGWAGQTFWRPGPRPRRCRRLHSVRQAADVPFHPDWEFNA